MKSILKTFNVGAISNFALIGMSSVLITACGGPDSSDPRAYDTNGPEIILNGNALIELDVNAAYTDAGATARDVWDGDNLVDQDASTEGLQAIKVEGLDTLDTSIVGSYQISYTAEDASGNIATAVRSIEVGDRTIPVITITGSNPLLVEFNGSFNTPNLSLIHI